MDSGGAFGGGTSGGFGGFGGGGSTFGGGGGGFGNSGGGGGFGSSSGGGFGNNGGGGGFGGGGGGFGNNGGSGGFGNSGSGGGFGSSSGGGFGNNSGGGGFGGGANNGQQGFGGFGQPCAPKKKVAKKMAATGIKRARKTRKTGAYGVEPERRSKHPVTRTFNANIQAVATALAQKKGVACPRLTPASIALLNSFIQTVFDEVLEGAQVVRRSTGVKTMGVKHLLAGYKCISPETDQRAALVVAKMGQGAGRRGRGGW